MEFRPGRPSPEAGIPGQQPYRVFLLRNGSIVRAEVIFCCTDEEAAEQARLLTEGHAVEVWQRDRCIAHWPKTSHHTKHA